MRSGYTPIPVNQSATANLNKFPAKKKKPKLPSNSKNWQNPSKKSPFEVNQSAAVYNRSIAINKTVPERFWIAFIKQAHFS